MKSKKLTQTGIQIENLSVSFGATEAVRNVNLEIGRGEILGVVGESGSGKSVTALTLMGLLAESGCVTSGRVVFDGTVLTEAGKPRDKALYRSFQGDRMSMVFQEPMTSLNPTKKVGAQVEEMLQLHTDLGREERRERVLESLVSVGLKDAEQLYHCYPHQLSGGMRQRVMIAMAVILHPDLIVADEPTTALDVTIQNQIITLLREINKRENNAMLFITHDLNLAGRICSRIAVMKDGRVVECGPAREILEHPAEEYTRRLVQAVPSRMKPKRGSRAVAESGSDAERGNGAGAENGNGAERESRADIQPVLRVHDLNVYYKEGSNSLFGQRKRRCVVSGADFALYRGETLGLVGESGCGKSSLSKAILGMNRNIEGQVEHFSTRPQMIFQDPYGSLNPCKTVEWLLQEPLRAAGRLDPARRLSEADMRTAVRDMLYKVGLDERYLQRRPSQLSGGQRQRISIGQALITKPGLVIADEPVSALDVTLQAQIMELMRRLQEEMGVAYLFISHDINVVYQMSDRIMVMKDGRIIEQGRTEEVFRSPQEEYTRLLLRES
ncbi:MAG: ABC transporter ATP-binding protein [Clostridium sp.]|nr:ABC transporter ATP-binding protein [Acetatifactor muris]MCM1527567.1 ABC transporter ATP-binding protein [Bacteroides sp.]MCM1563809.1 ABC transporter ATP-binding protein [Clostridium sp.]